ncbi:MAG: hypothetical protein ABI831_00575 [Betaproteobacteria bacterium]
MSPPTFLRRASQRLFARWFLLVLANVGLVHGATAIAARVAYVYGSNPAITANAFNTMLTGRGITVDLYSDATAALATTDFSPDDAIIIADDMPDFGGFQSYSHIRNAVKPVVAIGDWGAQFMNLTALPVIGAGSGFSTNGSDYKVHVADPLAPIWSAPSTVSQINQSLSLYTQAVPVNALSNPAPVQYSNRIGRLPGDPNHYSIIAAVGGARCYAYWGYRGLPALMTPSGINLFLNLAFGSPCNAGTYAINSAPATTAPVMDGAPDYGEWSLTPNRLEMDHGFLAVMNDNVRLYLLVDVPESAVSNNGNQQNDFWVTFDVDKNGVIDPAIDLNYAMNAGTHNLRYQHYLAPAQWELLSSSTKSSLGPGFDCYAADGTKVLNINTLMFDCAAHQLWEIAIDLMEINAQPGQIVRMGLRTYSPNPDFADEWPNSFDVDFSNLITIQLASTPIPPHDPNANIAFANPPFEITQVVQNVNNTIPLVADKMTAGRVSVMTVLSGSAQPVIEYLYGQRGSNDLPGSPLLQQINAPLAVNRGTLADTANFLLPPSWISAGEVTFHAEASDFNGHSIASNPQLLTFQGKQTPLYWMIRENTGTVNTPTLPAQASIDSYESYVRAVFPVPDVTFVQRSWSVLGPVSGTNLQTNIDVVDKYYSAIAAAYWTAIMMNKPPPYALPQMIFGAAAVGGGLSNPTWFNNSSGRAAVGGNATSGEGVVAHEFNHNLDRSSNGTWGRHVGACNASGPDPNWPNGSNPAIGEIGFDARLPWQDTSTAKTVIPMSVPDLMSYCTSGFLPTKWIAPYRYASWFGSTGFPNKSAQVPVNSLYITGTVNTDGTGSLDPVLPAPGMPIAPSGTGAWSVEISGVGIPTITHAFDVVFEDVEGNPQPVVFFNFVLSDPGGVTMVRLKHGAQILATVTKAAVLPTGAFSVPASGLLSGNVMVGWTLTAGTTPLAGLRHQLQFSADSGDTWIPAAVNLPGTTTSYSLDTSMLPMTSQGRLRLIILDGLNAVTIASPNTFSVGNHPPFVNILAPLHPLVPPGSRVLLQGQASDVDEPSLGDSGFVWTLDGATTVGVGRNQQAVLPNGWHLLSLTVRDSDGGTGTASMPIYVTDLVFDAPLDIDGSQSGTKYDALTDGLLIIRYLFGLTGTSLTNGALGPLATRTDPTSVKNYLDGMLPLLDVDGSGTSDALTDGLMLLRYLFGLRGNPLVNGAIAPGALRTTPEDVETYIRTLMP